MFSSQCCIKACEQDNGFHRRQQEVSSSIQSHPISKNICIPVQTLSSNAQYVYMPRDVKRTQQGSVLKQHVPERVPASTLSQLAEKMVMRVDDGKPGYYIMKSQDRRMSVVCTCMDAFLLFGLCNVQSQMPLGRYMGSLSCSEVSISNANVSECQDLSLESTRFRT